MSNALSLHCNSRSGEGCVVFTLLKENQQPLQVVVNEIYSTDYALFTWPSAPVLAQYVWYYDHLFRDKTVLEIGCGTAIPGMVAAKIGSNVILADKFTTTSRQLLVNNVTRNGCRVVGNIQSHDSSDKSVPPIRLMSLTWGDFNEEVTSLPSLDFVLASDCFYDDKDFEDIIATISFLLREKGHENSCCLTSYQIRDSDWSISCLMDFFGLEGREESLQQFEADSHQLLGSNLPGNHAISLFRLQIKSNQ